MTKRSRTLSILATSAFACVFMWISISMATYPKEPLKPTELNVGKIPVAKHHKKGILRVMSLNVAHGAMNRFGIVPLFRSAKTIKKRLIKNSAILLRENPDIVGLQEADGPSWWSGRFHHVNFLAQHGLFPYAILGIHVKTKSKRYGAALISRLKMHDPASYRFKSVGMFKKGFVISAFKWPGKPKMMFDVVSTHLHPSNVTIQRNQVNEIVEVVRKRKRPVIFLGDFNTTWSDHFAAPLKMLTRKLNLRVYKSWQNKGLYTHKGFRPRRIDWIFVSKRIQFASYRVVKDVVSDHYGIVADLKLLPKNPPTTIKPVKRSVLIVNKQATSTKAPEKRKAATTKTPVAKTPTKRKAPVARTAPAKRTAPAVRVAPAKKPVQKVPTSKPATTKPSTKAS